MEGTDFIKTGNRIRVKIPEALILMTNESIKAGVRLDETAREILAAKEAAIQANKGKSKKDVRPARRRPQLVTKSSEEIVQRSYRAHEDRRFGILVIGEQHRLSQKKPNPAEINHAPPLDYSFCLLNNIDEIVTEQEIPQTRRNFKEPRKTRDDRYVTASLRLSYNVLKDFDGVVNVMYKILDEGPRGLCWLDLSFNNISTLDEDAIAQMPNLQILYLHSNYLADMTEIPKLKDLPSLRSLTLFANPIEQEEAYRYSILYYMPNLKHLDFFGVTKSDAVASKRFGPRYEKFWAKKHVELMDQARKQKMAEAMSATARLLEESDEYDSESD